MSQLSKQSPKVVTKIAILLLQESDFKPRRGPYYSFRENIKLLKNLTRVININPDHEDLEFICQFIIDNYEILLKVIEKQETISSILDKITIPKILDFKINYETYGFARVIYTYETTRESYNEDWVEIGLMESYHEGFFDYWEGKVLNQDIEDYEQTDFIIRSVEELNEMKKPTLDKLVMENTKDILDSLDKETLINLRNLINQKISSF